MEGERQLLARWAVATAGNEIRQSVVDWQATEVWLRQISGNAHKIGKGVKVCTRSQRRVRLDRLECP
jgi:hypothetical protein